MRIKIVITLMFLSFQLVVIKSFAKERDGRKGVREFTIRGAGHAIAIQSGTAVTKNQAEMGGALFPPKRLLFKLICPREF